MSYLIYKHTCPDGGVYVGQTGTSDPNLRWKGGLGYLFSKSFYEAIQRFGWNNIRHEILYSNLSPEEAFHKEKELIEFYKQNAPICYNRAKGSECRNINLIYKYWIEEDHDNE